MKTRFPLFLGLLLAACGKTQNSGPAVTPPSGLGDVQVTTSVQGTFVILSYNGDATVSGYLGIAPTDSGLSVSLAPMLRASHPAQATSWKMDRTVTAWVRVGNQIRQTSAPDSGSLQVTYVLNNGYVEVQVQDCRSGATSCVKSDIVASQGKAPGTVSSVSDFFTTYSGLYTIQQAGGAPPHAQNNQATVDPVTDPTQIDIQTPFCDGNNCYAGDHFFAPDKTQIYRQDLGRFDQMYYLFDSSVTPARIYAWEDKSGIITFRNFQQSLNQQIVCFEHVMTYSGPLPPGT